CRPCPVRGRACVFYLTVSAIVVTRTVTHATKIEAHGRQPHFISRACQHGHHFIVHGATLLRVWVTDHGHTARRIRRHTDSHFQRPGRAVNPASCLACVVLPFKHVLSLLPSPDRPCWSAHSQRRYRCQPL